MKKVHLLLATILLSFPLAGKTIDQQQAAEKAVQFLSSRSVLRGTQDLELVYVGGSVRNELRADVSPTFYVYNVKGGRGFAIISGEDATRSILAYSFDTSFSQDAPNVRYFLNLYDKQIRAVKEADLATISYEPFPLALGEKVLPTAKWDQGYPYNDNMPMVYNVQGGLEQAPTGCSATALGIVMQYNKYPTHLEGGRIEWTSGIGSIVEAEDGQEYSNEREMSVNLADYTFDYNLLSATYSETSAEEECAEVAKLMQCLGAACRIEYDNATNGGSSAITMAIYRALLEHLRYTGTHSIERDGAPADFSRMILRSEIDNNRPVIYGSTEGEHIFVCDGYNDSDYFHFNLGWGGLANGFYQLDLLKPESLGMGAGSLGDYSEEAFFYYNLIPSDAEAITNPIFYDNDSEEVSGIYLSDPDAVIEAGEVVTVELKRIFPEAKQGGERFNIGVAQMDKAGKLKRIVAKIAPIQFKACRGDLLPLLEEIKRHPDEDKEDWIDQYPALKQLMMDLEASFRDVSFTFHLEQEIEEGDFLVGVTSQNNWHDWMPIFAINPDEKNAQPIPVIIELKSATINKEIRLAEDATKVYAAEGAIRIEAAATNVLVFNAQGAVVAAQAVDGEKRIALPRGVYFVKVGASIHRVVL